MLYHLEDDEDKDNLTSKESGILWMSGRKSRSNSQPRDVDVKDARDVSVGKSIHFDGLRTNNGSIEIDDRSY